MRCAVLGSPIAHSLSPGAAPGGVRPPRARLDLRRRRGRAPPDSSGFLDGLDETWRGLSLTMPLKRTVVPARRLARRLGASSSGVANTVLLDGRAAAGLQHRHPRGHGGDRGAACTTRSRSAVVLGGGATATSVLLALAELGCTTAPAARARPGARRGDRRRGRRPPARARALGRHDRRGRARSRRTSSSRPSRPRRRRRSCSRPAPRVPAVFEVVYDPWPTPLARAALDSGRAAGQRARPAGPPGRAAGGADDRASRCRSTWSARRAAPSWRARAVQNAAERR